MKKEDGNRTTRALVFVTGISIIFLGIVCLNLSYLLEVQSCQNLTTALGSEILRHCSLVPSPILLDLVLPSVAIGFALTIVGVFMKSKHVKKERVLLEDAKEIEV